MHNACIVNIFRGASFKRPHGISTTAVIERLHIEERGYKFLDAIYGELGL